MPWLTAASWLVVAEAEEVWTASAVGPLESPTAMGWFADMFIRAYYIEVSGGVSRSLQLCCCRNIPRKYVAN